jgi:hypothetical protein
VYTFNSSNIEADRAGFLRRRSEELSEEEECGGGVRRRRSEGEE